jgi:hypothetical protein
MQVVEHQQEGADDGPTSSMHETMHWASCSPEHHKLACLLLPVPASSQATMQAL